MGDLLALCVLWLRNCLSEEQVKVLHPILSDARVEIDAKKLDDVLAMAQAAEKIGRLLLPKLEDIEMSQIRSEGLEKLLLDVWGLVYAARDRL